MVSWVWINILSYRYDQTAYTSEKACWMNRLNPLKKGRVTIDVYAGLGIRLGIKVWFTVDALHR